MRLVQRLKAFAQHHLVRQTATLQIGGVAGTLVQALAGVVLARLLQPERFAQYALAFSVASITSIFIGGALTDAISPAISRAWARTDRHELRDVMGFYFRFVAACAAVTLVLVALLPTITAHLYHSGLIGGYADVVVVASVISTAVFAMTQLTLQVAGRIRSLALLTLTDTVVRYGLMLVFVYAGFGVWGAVSGHLAGAGILCLCSTLTYLYIERAHPIMVRFRELLSAARDASWQPLLKPTLWVLADSNFALLYGALPVAMVGLYVSGAPLAYFKLAFGYIILAMSIMGPVSTIMNVHFPTLQTTRPERLRQQFVQVTLVSVALSAVVTAVVVAIAPWVFRLLYGTAYLPAVHYVYQFTVLGALFGLGVGLGPMWRALGRVPTSILINTIVLGAGIPLGLWLIAHWGITGAVVMVTLWYSVSHAISFVYLATALPSSGTSAIVERR